VTRPTAPDRPGRAALDAPAPARPTAPGRRRALRTLALPGVVALAPLPVRADEAPVGPLLDALRAGGCVVLLRHARTVPGVGDPPGFRLNDCRTQRNLSEDGRTQARRIGERLLQAGVPVGPVRSSRWCRCIDTARLAFGRVEPWPVLDSFFAERADAGPGQTAALRDWALGWRGADNALLVTHQVNVTGLTGEWVAQGEAIVLRPDGGQLRALGRFGG
jgi:phosphohistidine phosphatase SixA